MSESSGSIGHHLAKASSAAATAVLNASVAGDSVLVLAGSLSCAAVLNNWPAAILGPPPATTNSDGHTVVDRCGLIDDVAR